MSGAVEQARPAAAASGGRVALGVAAVYLWLHWSRLAFNVASAVAVFVGFLRLYRHWLTAGRGETRR